METWETKQLVNFIMNCLQDRHLLLPELQTALNILGDRK